MRSSRALVVASLATLMLFSLVTDLSAQRNRRGRDRGRDSGGLKNGQAAPDFKLKSFDGDEETKLSDLYAKKPVVLFFGSYT